MANGREIFVGAGETPQSLALKFSNRHGLIAGATGTGKTVTLQILAEGFSNAGVPVFLSDVKGDLSGLSQAGVAKPKLLARAEQIGMQGFAPSPSPVVFWDLFGKKGTPVRTTISEMGPQLLSRLLDLNETQESIMTLVFEYADDEGMLLVNLADLYRELDREEDCAATLQEALTLEPDNADILHALGLQEHLEEYNIALFLFRDSLLIQNLIFHNTRHGDQVLIIRSILLMLNPK